MLFDGAPALQAEVARRPDQRARGLMQRRSLAAEAGMIFLYPREVRGGFWMLGTLVPLSIAYVNDGVVVSTAEMVPCRTEHCPSYRPDGPYTAAVEAPSGFFPRHGVRRGTTMRIVGPTPVPDP